MQCFGASGVEASDNLDFERSRMACGEYGDRRSNRLGSDSATERSQGAGDRRISAEQGGDVMRILSGRAAAKQRSHARGRAARNARRLNPSVKRIVDDVRRGGDKSLRSLRRAMGRPAKRLPLSKLRKREMQEAWKATPPPSAFRIAGCCEEHPKILRIAETERMETKFGRRLSWAIGSPFVVGRMLRSRRTVSAGFDCAHDGDSGASCGRQEHSDCFSQASAGGTGGCRHAGSSGVLSSWRSASNCCIGIWHRKYSSRGQNCGARK